jgi:hypothetical protein
MKGGKLPKEKLNARPSRPTKTVKRKTKAPKRKKR